MDETFEHESSLWEREKVRVWFCKCTKCSLVTGWVCLRPPTEALHWVVVVVGVSCVSSTVPLLHVWYLLWWCRG